MASKIILGLAIFVGLAAFILAFPSPIEDEQDNFEEQFDISRIKKAIIDQDFQLAMDRSGRFLAGGPNGFGNLSAIIQNAPNTTASITFIPLATVLFGVSG